MNGFRPGIGGRGDQHRLDLGLEHRIIQARRVVTVEEPRAVEGDEIAAQDRTQTALPALTGEDLSSPGPHRAAPINHGYTRKRFPLTGPSFELCLAFPSIAFPRRSGAGSPRRICLASLDRVS
jgi:hypothetical protein